MIKSIRTLAVLAVLGSAMPLAADERPAVANKLAPVERFIGEWVVAGKWSNGEALNARAVYTWGLGRRIMHAKTFVMNGDKEYQRYEGVIAWHPEKKKLFEISFQYDGPVSEVLFESKDKDTLHIGWAPFTEGKPANVRQTIHFLDNDQFQWVVLLKDGDKWQQIMDATWKRKVK